MTPNCLRSLDAAVVIFDSLDIFGMFLYQTRGFFLVILCSMPHARLYKKASIGIEVALTEARISSPPLLGIG